MSNKLRCQNLLIKEGLNIFCKKRFEETDTIIETGITCKSSYKCVSLMLDGDNWWHVMDDCAWSLVERRSATSGHMSNVQCCDSGRHSHGHMSTAPDYWLPPVIMKIFTPWLVILPQLPPTHTQLYPTTLLRTLKMMNLEKCLKKY